MEKPTFLWGLVGWTPPRSSAPGGRSAPQPLSGHGSSEAAVPLPSRKPAPRTHPALPRITLGGIGFGRKQGTPSKCALWDALPLKIPQRSSRASKTRAQLQYSQCAAPIAVTAKASPKQNISARTSLYHRWFPPPEPSETFIVVSGGHLSRQNFTRVQRAPRWARPARDSRGQASLASHSSRHELGTYALPSGLSICRWNCTSAK